MLMPPLKPVNQNKMTKHEKNCWRALIMGFHALIVEFLVYLPTIDIVELCGMLFVVFVMAIAAYIILDIRSK